MRLYDTHREDQIRDRHILYARSLIQRLDEGYTLEWVISTLVQEIPSKDLDILTFIPLANYLLEQSGRDLRIDLSLNITTLGGSVIIASDDVVEDVGNRLDEYLKDKQKFNEARHIEYAQMIADRLLGGIPISIIITIAKSDITSDEMDVKAVSQALNTILQDAGLPLKFDDYLELINVIQETP
jgi:hypothetical protein